MTRDTVGLALVDRPDPVPDGYRLQLGWTLPVLVDETHVEALRGARVEYVEGGREGTFRVLLPADAARDEAVPAAPESGCVSCSSAALPEIEALRRSMGRAADGVASSRGPSLPVVGQAPLVGMHR